MMKHTKETTTLERFFKDKDGRWAIAQFPNMLILVWILLLLVNLWAPSPHIRLLQSAVLFTWAYLELTEGTSYFRKALGAVVLVGVMVSFFTVS